MLITNHQRRNGWSIQKRHTACAPFVCRFQIQFWAPASEIVAETLILSNTPFCFVKESTMWPYELVGMLESPCLEPQGWKKWSQMV